MKKIAICIGHSRFISGRRDGGAVSVGRVNEWTYNNELAGMIQGILADNYIDSITIRKYEGAGYTSAMRWLAGHLRTHDVDAAVELHFNAASSAATGHEWLYWHSSKKGQELAMAADNEMRKLVPGIKGRGTKPKFQGDRGAEFLRMTHCPAFITEPFFGSNPTDWKNAVEKKQEIAQAIANALLRVKLW